MYLLECVTAYVAIQAMMETECSYKTAHALYMLKKELQPHADFFVREERKLVAEFAVKDEKGQPVIGENGTFRFRDGVDPSEYERKRRELGTIPVEKEFKAVRAPVPPVIKPAQLEALEKFIVFEEEKA